MAEPTVADIERKLERERKGLLASSSLLFFQQVAGVRFGDVIVSGVKIEIERPQYVVWAIWALWGYYLLRYFVYFLQVPDTGFRAACRGANQRIFWRYACWLARKQASGGEPRQEGVDYRFKARSSDGERQTDSGFRCRVRGQFVSSAGALTQDHEETVEIRGLIFRLCKAWGFASAMATSSAPTEYWLPFAVAVAPLVAAIVFR